MIEAPKPADEEARLALLRALRILDTEAEQEFDDLTQLAAHICQTPIALISLVDAERQWFKSRVGLDVSETPRELAFCAHAILRPDEPLVLIDSSQDPRFADNPLVTGPPDVQSYFGMPLSCGGFPVGTLCVIDHRPRELSNQQLEMLRRLARQVVSQLDLRRLAQEERRQRDAAAEKEKLLQAIFDSAADGIVVANERGDIQSLNTAAERIFGYEAAELLGENLRRLMPEPFRSEHDDFLRHYRKTPERSGIGREVVGQRKSGVHFPLHLALSQAHTTRGLFYAAFLRDFSELRQAERAKAEFVSSVSHELRTPLTSLRGALGLLEGGAVGELPAEAGSLLGIARSNTDRLIRLINDILDVSKLDAGKLALKLGRIDVDSLLTAALSEVAHYAKDHGVTVARELDAAALGRVELWADRDRTLQVLVNLLSNAIKFSDRGQRVCLRLSLAAEEAQLEIIDQGPGIPKTEIPRIFGRFTQLDASDRRRRGGTGLGLSICKAIAELHGGRIDVASTLGAGSTFALVLPITEQAAQPSFGRMLSVAPGKALLVTRRGDLRSSVAALLTQAGHPAIFAEDLGTATSKLEAGGVRLLLLGADIAALPEASEFLADERADGEQAKRVAVVEMDDSGSVSMLDWAPHLHDHGGLQQPASRIATGLGATGVGSLGGERGVSAPYRQPRRPPPAAPPVTKQRHESSVTEVMAKLRQLAVRFRQGLPARGLKLSGLVRDHLNHGGPAEPAVDIAHRLHGTAGSHGLGTLGEAAGRLEYALLNAPSAKRDSKVADTLQQFENELAALTGRDEQGEGVP